jgi:hypothetical protein
MKVVEQTNRFESQILPRPEENNKMDVEDETHQSCEREDAYFLSVILPTT